MQRLELQQELTLREREYRTLVENSPDVIARFDLQFRCRYANPVLMQAVGRLETGAQGCSPHVLWGQEAGAKVTQHLVQVVGGAMPVEFELQLSDALGPRICSLVSLTPEVDDNASVSSVLLVGLDIGELEDYQYKVHQMALYDSLKGMPNRVLFHDRLAQVLKDAAYHRCQAVGDLERFKQINDTMGHAAGDVLLKEFALRLRASAQKLSHHSLAGRRRVRHAAAADRYCQLLACVAGKVKTTVNQSSWLDGQEIFVSCSVGIAVYPTDREVAEELLKYQIRRCTPPNAQSATTSVLPQGPDGARPTAADP